MATEEFSTATELHSVKLYVKELTKLINSIWIFKSFFVFLISQRTRCLTRECDRTTLEIRGGKASSHAQPKPFAKFSRNIPVSFIWEFLFPCSTPFLFLAWWGGDATSARNILNAFRLKRDWFGLFHTNTHANESQITRGKTFWQNLEKWTFLPRTSFSNFFIEIKINYTARFITLNLENRCRFISIIAKSPSFR